MSLRRSPLLPAITRIVCLLVAAASVIGLYFVSAGANSAAAAGSSAVTVSWDGDSGTAKQYQPQRSASSPDYNGFKNIKVTVDQTTAISDQAIEVNVTGFAGTRSMTDAQGTTFSSAQNFFQAMQCWGADPLAADFVQTCEWGGRYVDNNGLGNSVYLDNIPRVATKFISPDAAQPVIDVPFLTVGEKVPLTGRQIANGTSTTYPLLDLFSPSSTNEVQSARINLDGSSVFPFETQTAYQSPSLGCGTEGHTRCWLVLVPRGTVYGGHDDSCSSILDSNNDPYSYGRPNSIQAGSPVNPGCDYWKNRINVPLDFTPLAGTCKVGNTERRTVGSQLLVGAMASWQPQLCSDLSTTYALSTNPDSVGREQLVQGQAGLAFTSFPVVKSELDDSDQAALATTDLGYAPVAVSAAAVAFLAEGPNGRITNLTLSPRLVAKLLTQSYRFQMPATTGDPAKNFAHLGPVNQRYAYLFQDPDFQKLNPTNYTQFSTNPALVLPGPAGADAIRQVWKWVLGDKSAASFLAGNPDDWGMTVNPYYLPKTNTAAVVPTFISNDSYVLGPCPASRPEWADDRCRAVGLSNLDGSPYQISTQPEDTFLKADESLVPIDPPAKQPRFGSIQSSPYADTFLTAARTAFRADPGAKTIWDPTAVTSNTDPGDYVSSGPQILGQRFMIAITDAPSAERYALTSASLRLDNSTDAAPLSDATMNGALSGALVATSNDAVRQVDPAKATAGQYPLTTVVYAAVNLSTADAAALTDYSNFIGQVTTKGQIQGTDPGQLPPGYVPLTPELAGQAQVAAAAIKAYVPPVATGGGDNGPAQDDYNGGPYTGDGNVGSGSGPAGVGASSSPAPSAAPGTTPKVSGGFSVGQVALGGSLATGLAGAIFSPLLFRGRRLI